MRKLHGEGGGEELPTVVVTGIVVCTVLKRQSETMISILIKDECKKLLLNAQPFSHLSKMLYGAQSFTFKIKVLKNLSGVK